MATRQAKWLKTPKGKKYLEKTKQKRKKLVQEWRKKNPNYQKEYYQKNKIKLDFSTKKYRSDGVRKWTRKGQCPYCNNKTGSYHNKKCPIAYTIPPKARR